MSLINQMLRDLAARCKIENPQPAAKPVSVPADGSSGGGRWLWLVLLGISLAGLLWFGLKVLPAWAPAGTAAVIRPAESVVAETEAAKDRLPAVALPATAAPLSRSVTAGRPTSQADNQREPLPTAAGSAALPEPPVVPAKLAPQAKISDQKRSAVVPISSSKPQASVPAAALELASRGRAREVALRGFGVVEGIDAVRLMFEFARLPEYRVSLDQQHSHSVMLLFFATEQGDRLEIPPFRGPLLETLELTAVKQGLQLTVGMAKPSTLRAYALPADAAHGERLLVELSVAGGSQARSPGAAVTAGVGQGTPLGNSGADPGQQVDVLSRQALRYLEQGDAAAAKTQLRKALELTPDNVSLRQQLVDQLHRDRQLEEVETLLLAGLALTPQDPALRTRYGRLLFDRNQLAEALELMLAKPIPDLPEQPDYHALLAALEQESGRFANAATRYRELLRLRPAQAEWWLLLALAYEQLNDAKQAAVAYRQALENTGLSTEHRQFSLERLERLQRLEN